MAYIAHIHQLVSPGDADRVGPQLRRAQFVCRSRRRSSAQLPKAKPNRLAMASSAHRPLRSFGVGDEQKTARGVLPRFPRHVRSTLDTATADLSQK